MARVENACAGPFGAVYDFWIEREPVAAVVGRLLWGIDTRPMFASMAPAVAAVPDGGVIIDVPCGGGVAFRALRPDHHVRYLAVDLDEAMLARARRRGREHRLDQIEFMLADVRQMPFDDGEADLCLTYSGLHMIPDPWRALNEIARCLRPGGEIVGSTFVSDGALRQRLIFGLGRRTGHVAPAGTSGDLERWLGDAGFEAVEVLSRSGFALFSARKPQ